VRGPTVFAIDWSGARRPQGIWLAAVRDGELVDSSPVATREEVIAALARHPAPVIAGFDFSFSVPAWFAGELGCATVEQVWERAATDGERWLHPTLPFWRNRCAVPPERRFRRCERRFPTAKSVFQLVGNGQVGAGSVRGMPLLAELRRAGYAIWPFDGAGSKTALEIYPSALRRLRPDDRNFDSPHERDAVSSAWVLWEHRHEVAHLPRTRDPVTRIEGDVWTPSIRPTASPSAAR
jgi:hypothetical protein